MSEASVRNRGAQSGPAEPIHVPWTGPALDESAEAEGSLQDHGATVIAPGAAIVHAPAKPARQGAGALRALRSRTPRPPRVRVRVHTLDSLRYREFRLLWVSTLGIGGGFWVQQLIVGWLTYSLTRSPLLTSLALGLEALPFLLGGPIGGILADQWDRRRLLMAVSAYQAAVTAGFSVVVLLDRVETWHIFAFVLAMGSSWAVSSPARFAIVPDVVPKRSLINAFALRALAFNCARLATPAAAGLLIAVTGPGPTLVVGALMYLGSSLAIAAMRVDTPDRSEARREKPLQRFREGVRYARNDRLVLGLILVVAGTELLLLPFVHGLMPVYASEVFHVGPAGLGLLMSVVGIGSVIGTIMIASIGDIRSKGRVIVVALALIIAGAVAFSRVSAMPLAVPFLMLLSGSFTTLCTVNSASIQSIVPERLRGRVSSVGTMIAGLFPLGNLLAGGLAELFGAPTATLAAGAMLLLFSAGLLLKFRQLWSFGR